jgi:hypothetical protein
MYCDVLICIVMYCYVLLCIVMYCYVLLCIVMYVCLYVCIYFEHVLNTYWTKITWDVAISDELLYRFLSHQTM